MSYASVGHVRGLLGDGTEAQSLAVIGTFEKCEDESMPKGFANGRTRTTCAIALAPSAQVKVAGAGHGGNRYNAANNGKAIARKSPRPGSAATTPRRGAHHRPPDGPSDDPAPHGRRHVPGAGAAPRRATAQ
ncbi:hypothetical protein ACIQZO_24880 [Streptomyces sp. NPDC097617]|uniref:hypothetical protein n=1 Tax=Streptomyces sp. NPDC097617 TaxID=3366091 RepID=UPI0038105961